MTIQTTGAAWQAEADRLQAHVDTKLANPGTGYERPENLMALSHRLAGERAAAHLLDRAAGILAHPHTDNWQPTDAERVRRATFIVADTLRQGPDDGWSGRGNDLRRAAFDAVRSRADDMLRTLAQLAKEV
jgi:hypothetical protein